MCKGKTDAYGIDKKSWHNYGLYGLKRHKNSGA